MTLLIGPASDPQAIVQRAHELGLSASTARWLSAGVLQADAVDEWVGLEPVGGQVNLRAPEPEPGDEPNAWLHFDGDMHAGTVDLLALDALALKTE